MGDMDLLQPIAMTGIPCAVVTRLGAPSLYSRFTRSHLRWDDFSQNTETLLDALMRFGAAQSERPVLFYEEDAQLLFVSRYREQLKKAFRFVVADAALVEDLVDKSRFQDLARCRGVPVPAARRFHPATLEPDDLGLDFPLIIKPLTQLERRSLRIPQRLRAVAAGTGSRSAGRRLLSDQSRHRRRTARERPPRDLHGARP